MKVNENLTDPDTLAEICGRHSIATRTHKGKWFAAYGAASFEDSKLAAVCALLKARWNMQTRQGKDGTWRATVRGLASVTKRESEFHAVRACAHYCMMANGGDPMPPRADRHTGGDDA